MPSNISAYDADFPQELIEKYGITDVGKKLLTSVMNPGIPVSEDCLTLNIWTKPQTGERRKAVMVWIHGGSFVSGILHCSCLSLQRPGLTIHAGSSAVPDYNGKFFADQEDVVLVSIKYVHPSSFFLSSTEIDTFPATASPSSASPAIPWAPKTSAFLTSAWPSNGYATT